MEFLKRNKEKVRTGLYFISSGLILYYIYDINVISNQLSMYELKDTTSLLLNPYTQNIVIDFTETMGGLLWDISMNIINIIFLVMLMLMIYIDERIERVKNGFN